MQENKRTRLHLKKELNVVTVWVFFSDHVIVKTLLKGSNWLLRFLFAFCGIFSFNLLLSGKKCIILFNFFLLLLLLLSKADEF